MKEIDKIYDIFKEFFGEEYVDLQERTYNTCSTMYSILVHYPEVRITNEYNRYRDLKHLFVKVEILASGHLNNVVLNRSEYTSLEFNDNYMHSHVSIIPKNDFTEFQNPCFGTSPIVKTMGSLRADFSEDLWQLFCLELDKYVKTESIAGIPYHKLEALGPTSTEILLNTPNNNIYTRFKPLLNEFLEDFLDEIPFEFNYVYGNFAIAMSDLDYLKLISNKYIKWYNNNSQFQQEHPKQEVLNGLFIKGVIRNNRLYKYNNISVYSYYIGKPVCVFKGEPYTINITEEKTSANTSLFLNPSIAFNILYYIQQSLNYNYGREIPPSEKIKYV